MKMKYYHIDQYISEKSEPITREDLLTAARLRDRLVGSLFLYLRLSPHTPVARYVYPGGEIFVERNSPSRPLTYTITFAADIEPYERHIRAFLALMGTPVGWSINGRQLTINFLSHVSETEAFKWLTHASVRLDSLLSS